VTALSVLDHLSVFIFALTGALTASRAQLDMVGFVFIASLTGLGGGTLRDLLLDRNPILWMGAPEYLVTAAAAAVLVFFTAHLLESRYRALLWFDAAALAVAVPAGVAAATGMSQTVPVVLLMGVMTGTFGGLMRDVVCNEVPLVLKQGELYVSCALAGALAGVVVLELTGARVPALATIALVTFALRAGSLAFGWKLPVYRSRPPRRY
jgi:uncharacterized membrane protein YeiH